MAEAKDFDLNKTIESYKRPDTSDTSPGTSSVDTKNGPRRSRHPSHGRRRSENKKTNKITETATRRVLSPFFEAIQRAQKEMAARKREKGSEVVWATLSSDNLTNLSAKLSDNTKLPSLLQDTADVLKTVTKSFGVTLFMVNIAQGEIYQQPKNVISLRHRVTWNIDDGNTVACFVAKTKEFLIVDDILGDSRFPKGIGWNDLTVKAVLCVPVVTPDHEIIAVIELYRDVEQSSYEEIVIAVTGWMGAAIYHNQQRYGLQQHQNLHEFLLQLTEHYFCDDIPTEKVISEIMSFAKQTVGAETGSFYLVDPDSSEFVADVFDEGINISGKREMFKKIQRIRFSADKSIAGEVARTGEMINVKDAYTDLRFNKDLDLQTGFITRSILCMPILGKDKIVLGVVQLINKKIDPCFSTYDEILFQTFSVYCALVLNFSRLQQQMKRSNVTNNIHLEMLVYHMAPCRHDISTFLAKPILDHLPPNFDRFSWYVTGFEDILAPLLLHMFQVVSNNFFTDTKPVCTFILMVEKGYRNNPYHNFHHAFNVCHCMYNILKRNLQMFTPMESLALLIAALCHDIDHQGLTNNFLKMTDHDLTLLFPESTLENHHFQVTMMILQGSNVLASVPEIIYKEMVEVIHHAIIATDLALYFKCRTNLLATLQTTEFDIKNPTHRVFLKDIMMTSCDLSGQSKPFPVAKKIAESLYREFYNQGDLEKEMGFMPLSLNDREKQDMIPDDQVAFITYICLPCSELLFMLLPNTEELYFNCRELKNLWKEIVAVRGKRVWKPEESIVKKD